MSNRRKPTIKTILFPTDFSEASEHAATTAFLLARVHGAKLKVIHVMDTTTEAAGFYVPHLSYDNLDREMLLSAEAMLKKFCAKFFKNYKQLDFAVITGTPYKEILKATKAVSADMVVMGSYRKQALEKLFLGSTTERVLRKSTCPVTVVPE